MNVFPFTDRSIERESSIDHIVRGTVQTTRWRPQDTHRLRPPMKIASDWLRLSALTRPIRGADAGFERRPAFTIGPDGQRSLSRQGLV